MSARLTALWLIAAVLIVGGFAASWGLAVGSAERYANFNAGSLVQPDIDWAYILSSLTFPLFIAGFTAALAALAVHALLWRGEQRSPSSPPSPS